jgi:hypothetical protein
MQYRARQALFRFRELRPKGFRPQISSLSTMLPIYTRTGILMVDETKHEKPLFWSRNG